MLSANTANVRIESQSSLRCRRRNKAALSRIRKSASQSPFYGRRLRLLRQREDNFATPGLKTANRAASVQLEDNPDPANSRARRSIRNQPNNDCSSWSRPSPSAGSGEQSQLDETQQRQHPGRRLGDGAGGSAHREIIKSIRTSHSQTELRTYRIRWL